MRDYLFLLWAFAFLLSCSVETAPEQYSVSESETPINLDSLANGHAFVDLGICNHLMWATMNLGAQTPQDRGKLYKWGVTEPYQEGAGCYWEQYPYFICSDGPDRIVRLSKYNTNIEQYEEQDNLVTLQPCDDPARCHWGGGWRMPDASELDSLVSLCEWTTDTIDGQPGFRVTGRRPGFRDNSIFLPNTGAVDGLSHYHPDRSGFYWSRNILPGVTYNNGIGIVTNVDKLCSSYYYRYIAQAIRPVFLPGERLVKQIQMETRKTSISLRGGGTKLSATVIPANASNPRLYWASSDCRIATVDTAGIITPVTEGICYISANSTDGSSCSATCMVSVVDPQHPEHDYVDMGICGHLWWATMNVGAQSPEEAGDYLDWNQARQVMWGEHWRLPTSSEIDSLIAGCDWEWCVENGVTGYKVTTRFKYGYRETSLFLPAAGSLENKDIKGYGQNGYYWSTSALHDIEGCGINLSFGEDSPYWNYSPIESRFPIRMVYSFE